MLELANKDIKNYNYIFYIFRMFYRDIKTFKNSNKLFPTNITMSEITNTLVEM